MSFFVYLFYVVQKSISHFFKWLEYVIGNQKVEIYNYKKMSPFMKIHVTPLIN